MGSRQDWISTETNHYRLYYHPGSYAEKHIYEIKSWQEECYLLISKTLKVTMDRKIRMYLCMSREEIAKETGCPACNAMTFDYDMVFSVVNDAFQCLGPHEDAHILSYQIAVPESVFLKEGIAMYFDKQYHGKSNIDAAKQWAFHSDAVNVCEYLDNDMFYRLPEEVSYPLAGAFAEWLIFRYGMDAFLVFYKSNGDTVKAYSAAPAEISAAFAGYLAD